MRQMSELFRSSTAQKFADGVTKPPKKLPLSFITDLVRFLLYRINTSTME